MSDLNPIGVSIELGGVERHFLFTLNVVDAVESHYGCTVFDALEKLTSRDTQSEAIRFFVATLLNDDADYQRWKNPEFDLQHVTEKQVGWLVTVDNINKVMAAILKAYGISMPEPDEDDDPNQTSGQQSD